ncbi:hypothetical protein GGS23DRAFT_434460 [Durotheca rogersii]|uniref:uncharacterized protein n=1 Tax=Durotheca rogersii TaxID=419775 RepID=UPI00221F910E|nr:uncharacterized protein GGS23DRAFT_434460 [Durotheca rogersii]KAI5865589.1 hypothetical protein GGS23DRAFT_434460 [Durotheca rogersii]
MVMGSGTSSDQELMAPASEGSSGAPPIYPPSPTRPRPPVPVFSGPAVPVPETRDPETPLDAVPPAPADSSHSVLTEELVCNLRMHLARLRIGDDPYMPSPAPTDRRSRPVRFSTVDDVPLLNIAAERVYDDDDEYATLRNEDAATLADLRQMPNRDFRACPREVYRMPLPRAPFGNDPDAPYFIVMYVHQRRAGQLELDPFDHRLWHILMRVARTGGIAGGWHIIHPGMFSVRFMRGRFLLPLPRLLPLFHLPSFPHLLPGPQQRPREMRLLPERPVTGRRTLFLTCQPTDL